MGAAQSTTPNTGAPPSSTVTPRGESRTNESSWFQSYFLPSILSTEPAGPKHRHRRPGPAAIVHVAGLLIHKGLPLDLAHRILDEARYWSVCARESRDQVVDVEARRPPPRSPSPAGWGWTNGQEDEMGAVMSMPGGGLEDVPGKTWLLVSSPIGCMSRRSTPTPGPAADPDKAASAHASAPTRSVWLRRIVIDTFSRDQGWSSNSGSHYGTYEHSYSWFEISLLRDGRELPDSRRSIQNNVHAGQYFKPHRISLEGDDDFVKRAEEGDRVVLWARAEFPGWRNVVRECGISLFTTPYAPVTD